VVQWFPARSAFLPRGNDIPGAMQGHSAT
jgi:hypothetical protein